MRSTTASFFVILGTACYGLLGTLVKFAYQSGFTTAEVTSGQVLTATLFFLFISVWNYKKVKQLSIKTGFLLVLTGVNYGSCSIAYYLALHSLPASLAVLLMFQFVWMGIVYESIKLNKFPNTTELLTVVLVLSGTFFAIDIKFDSWQSVSWIGVFYGMLSAILYTLFLISSSTVATNIDPWVRTSWMVLGQAIVILSVFPPMFLINGALGKGLWMWGILLALAAIIVPIFLLNLAAPYLGTGLVSILASMELVVSITMSALVLRENITLINWLGVCLVLLGIVVAERGKLVKNDDGGS